MVVTPNVENTILNSSGDLSYDFNRSLKGNEPSWPVSKEEENEFWDSRPILGKIRRAAANSTTGSWALLGVVITRAISATAPDIQLPAIIGTATSLNFFVALDGSSGGGKDLAIRTGANLITNHDRFEEGSLGSGEGLVERYGHFEHDGKSVVFKQTKKNILFTVPEIDLQSAVSNRTGSTLMPILRSAYMGDPLDFGYKSQNRSNLKNQSYRMCCILGVQPERAQAFFQDAAGGTPQRFIFLPTLDPNGLDYDSEFSSESLDWNPVNYILGLSGVKFFDVCKEACDDIRRARIERLRTGNSDLDSHALLAREKVAAGLSLLDSRLDITKEDWDLAGFIQKISNYSRLRIQSILQSIEQYKNTAKAKNQARREEIIDDEKSKAQRSRAFKTIRKVLVESDDWVPKAQISKRMKADIRDFRDECLEELTSTGEIEFENYEYRGNKTQRFRIKK